MKKFLLIGGLALASLAPSVAFAQTTPPTIDEQVTATEEKVDKVGVVGGKAMTIAAGLALGFTVIAFIKKAKR